MFSTVQLSLLVLLLVAGLVPGRLIAAGLDQRVAQLQKKYQQLHSLEFDFAQTTQNGGRLKQGSGNAVFYRPAVVGTATGAPGIMRWNYTVPTAQTIINDGTSLSIYTPEDKQLLVSPAQDMESDITYAIFTGTKNLLDEFAATSGDPRFTLNEPPAGCEALQLTPRKPHPQVKRVQLWVTGDLTIKRLLMEDHFGALTELTFTNVRFNTLRPGDLQQMQALRDLDLVPGTEIIRQ
ncbi:MAG: outer membrane lipoprotein carrier protein LolA [Desulfobulbus sp.]|uniref:LolA family protein n=1 Tax=Desulfobulbus sp. TaxID=895 RepID=UPI00284C20AB|nr:outer membrane lipoprotein carrier protein LolA [Desulfobulbus sp.]MDR2551539.1 outer membrane lipoprotein carrier protein LolA [Desulfobulbus sp.]